MMNAQYLNLLAQNMNGAPTFQPYHNPQGLNLAHTTNYNGVQTVQPYHKKQGLNMQQSITCDGAVCGNGDS